MNFKIAAILGIFLLSCEKEGVFGNQLKNEIAIVAQIQTSHTGRQANIILVPILNGTKRYDFNQESILLDSYNIQVLLNDSLLKANYYEYGSPIIRKNPEINLKVTTKYKEYFSSITALPEVDTNSIRVKNGTLIFEHVTNAFFYRVRVVNNESSYKSYLTSSFIKGGDMKIPLDINQRHYTLHISAYDQAYYDYNILRKRYTNINHTVGVLSSFSVVVKSF